MIFETFPVGPLGCNCSILGDGETKQAILVDPGGDVPKILARIQAHELKVKYILHTHAHYDHIMGTRDAQEQLGAQICLHEGDQFLYDNLALQLKLFGMSWEQSTLPVEYYIHQGDQFSLGSQTLEVFHTPGHTPGSCCFYWNNPHTPLLLAGDTLFRQSIGRTDLWGGDHGAILKSIREKLLVLPDQTRVITGHGPETNIGQEKRNNPFLN